MLASKIICDDTYSNKSLQEIRVHDFTSPGPYPTVVLPDRTSTFHALFEPQYQQLDSFIHRPRHPSFEGCPRYPQSSDHIPIFAPDPSSSFPSFTACITLPSKDAPVIPSPPITNPSSPPIPQGLSFNLDLSCVVGFSSNTSRCAWAWTRQGRLGRIEPRGCSGYPPWSRNHFNVCETQGPSHR